ncbi:hypothetical protein RclHR1_06750003 [Rhizophagus clarus]|uniref:Uncharacterized protein n=1 Tax=Rhizophagus clarus TaxID=94130 RepID=A0A2Z6SJS3_9GLOM|nr:hypothetical protein RclHR1_06750003 [Rhizophagus clarus]GES92906.1 hypothetical protein GLOIN_2v1600825 [Rhizophagus clarus]
MNSFLQSFLNTKKCFTLKITLLEYLAYICFIILFIIIFINVFYLCLLFESLKLPPDTLNFPGVIDDPNILDEVDILNFETYLIIIFYIPERIPYEIKKIQEIELMPYQRKKRPKYEWVILLRLISLFSKSLTVKVEMFEQVKTV